MAKLKEAFVRDIMNHFQSEEITFYKMVELLNEEAKREVSADEAGLFSRHDCVFQYCPHPELCKDKCIN
jgi:Ca2+-binding EF-hand superfamily protein